MVPSALWWLIYDIAGMHNRQWAILISASISTFYFLVLTFVTIHRYLFCLRVFLSFKKIKYTLFLHVFPMSVYTTMM